MDLPPSLRNLGNRKICGVKKTKAGDAAKKKYMNNMLLGIKLLCNCNSSSEKLHQ
ncbi:unnamed protein product [Rhodiola kirilowii]